MPRLTRRPQPTEGPRKIKYKGVGSRLQFQKMAPATLTPQQRIAAWGQQGPYYSNLYRDYDFASARDTGTREMRLTYQGPGGRRGARSRVRAPRLQAQRGYQPYPFKTQFPLQGAPTYYPPPQGNVIIEPIMPPQEGIEGYFGEPYYPYGGGGGGRVVRTRGGGPGRLLQGGRRPLMSNLPRWLEKVTTWKGIAP